jgi:hypothetical protein
MISIFHHVCFHHPPITPYALHSALARADARTWKRRQRESELESEMEEIAPAIWNGDIIDLSSPDKITLAGITIEGEVGASIRDALASEQARVLAEHGARAFECSKEGA